MPQSAKTPAIPAIGSPMPDISLVDPSGAQSTLHKVRGASVAIVQFMRSSTCPVCLAHARTITRMLDSSEFGDARHLLIAPGAADAAALAARRLGDSPASVWGSGADHAAVGLGRFLTIQHSGTFVLDDDGTVLLARAATLPTASFSRSETLAALAARVRS
ncbi:hypothetical protein [Agromyces bauzanensis]